MFPVSLSVCGRESLKEQLEPSRDDREVRGAQDRSATHNSANLPNYLDFGVYHT